jgi:hypothetical protein
VHDRACSECVKVYLDASFGEIRKETSRKLGTGTDKVILADGGVIEALNEHCMILKTRNGTRFVNKILLKVVPSWVTSYNQVRSLV